MIAVGPKSVFREVHQLHHQLPVQHLERVVRVHLKAPCRQLRKSELLFPRLEFPSWTSSRSSAHKFLRVKKAIHSSFNSLSKWGRTEWGSTSLSSCPSRTGKTNLSRRCHQRRKSELPFLKLVSQCPNLSRDSVVRSRRPTKANYYSFKWSSTVSKTTARTHGASLKRLQGLMVQSHQEGSGGEEEVQDNHEEDRGRERTIHSGV